jgi:hypothetical protein
MKKISIEIFLNQNNLIIFLLIIITGDEYFLDLHTATKAEVASACKASAEKHYSETSPGEKSKRKKEVGSQDLQEDRA